MQTGSPQGMRAHPCGLFRVFVEAPQKGRVFSTHRPNPPLFAPQAHMNISMLPLRPGFDGERNALESIKPPSPIPGCSVLSPEDPGRFFCAEARRPGPRPLPTTQDYTQGGWEGTRASFCAEVRRTGPRPHPTTQDYTQGGWVGHGPFFVHGSASHRPAPPPNHPGLWQGGWEGTRASFCAEVRRSGPRPLPAARSVGEASGRGSGPLCGRGWG